MPPRRHSRHSFAYAVKDASGHLVLHGTEPFRFKTFGDTREHVVRDGDTLYTLAGAYYRKANIPRPSGLWWVIADFQPSPIHDPTLQLDLGRIIYIPSVRTLVEEIFAERRRRLVAR